MASSSQAQRIYSGQLNSNGGAIFQGDLHAARDININNITTVRPLARSLQRSCLTSSERFKQVQNELGALLVVLEITEENSKEMRFDAGRHPHLCALSQSCHRVLQDLQRLKDGFDSFGTQSQLTWERMEWNMDDLDDIRSRLMSNTNMLNAFNSNIMMSSQARMEQMLRRFIDEVSTGKRRSVVSIQTIESLSADQKKAWRQLRKELESVGITPALFEQHRTVIVATLQKAIREEGLAGDIPDTYDLCSSSDSGQEDLEALFTPGAISSAEPYVKQTDEPLEQPIQDRNPSDQVPKAKVPRPSKFFAAVRCGNVTLVEQLMIEGAAMDLHDRNGHTPLAHAAANGHEAVVKLLLSKGAAVDSMDNKDGMTPLSYAAQEGHKTVVKLLLSKGTAVDTWDRYGYTPLANAAVNGHEEVIKLLLSKGAAVDSTNNKYGETPLALAARNGHETVAKLLLSKGATVNSMNNKHGETPLAYAAADGHEAIVKLLLDNGAAVDSRNECGRTPLSWAAAEGHKTVVKLLLDNGVAVDSRNMWDETPLYWAARNGHKAVVELLQLHAQQP